ncbi:hypothetical protein SOVF_213530, partial [Spinacia oleracea]
MIRRTTRHALGKSHSENLGGNSSLAGVTIDEAPRALSLGNHLRESHPSPSKFTLDTMIAKRNSFKHKDKLSYPEKTTETMLTETDVIKEKEEHSSNMKCTTQNVISENTTFEAIKDPSSPKKDNEEEGERPHSLTKTIETRGAENIYSTKEQEQQYPTTKKTIPKATFEKLAPNYANVTEETYNITSNIQKLYISSPRSTGDKHMSDKGVSVKEYLKIKLEPGEDERALSQVITEVISPRRSPTEKGVVEKVKTAVTMLLHTDDPSVASTNSSGPYSKIPASTNSQE